MSNLLPQHLCALACVCFALALPSTRAVAEEITCPGEYGGHLQGVAADEAQNIYWSFTVDLVKTDKTGALLKTVKVANHHGDLTFHDGKVYVAVNLGKFNQEPGQADSWVYVYNAEDLALISRHPVTELVHGAGGIAYHDGRLMVVGGLPKTHNQNYVYEYDLNLRFVKRHVIASGQTNMGIQTAAFFNGRWWFGCYEDKKGLLETGESFTLLGRHDPNFSVGIAPWTPKKCLRGITTRTEDKKRWTGSVVVDVPGKKPAE